jgi:mono/diheme cytochrome c family protein
MRIPLSIAALCAVAVTIGACGTEAVSVPSSSQYYKGAVLFREHCSGCHSLAVVGAEGSAVGVSNRVKTQGPNFNFRKEQVNQVLYAIHNGGFSGAIMPENVVTGQEAKEVAEFLAAYAGTQAPKVPATNIPTNFQQ